MQKYPKSGVPNPWVATIEPFGTRPQKWWVSVHARTPICASSGWAHAYLLHLGARWVCVVTTHANGAAWARLLACCSCGTIHSAPHRSAKLKRLGNCPKWCWTTGFDLYILFCVGDAILDKMTYFWILIYYWIKEWYIVIYCLYSVVEMLVSKLFLAKALEN